VKKKIYIINKISRAAAYGIGTYTSQLTACLKKSSIEFEIIHLFSEGSEVTVEEKDGYRQILIPAIELVKHKSLQYYSRNVVCLLREFIPSNSGYELIFHLNFMNYEHLVKELKKAFRCKVILTVHYTNWSFDLFGNYKILLKTLNAKKKDLSDFEKRIVNSFMEDVRMINRCDRLICVARHSLDSFTENSNINRKKCFVINNGLRDEYKKYSEEKKMLIRRKYFISKSARIILFAGRLEPVKGLVYLIKSYKQVLQKHPDSLLIVAGEGHNFNTLFKDAETCWTKIIFTGKLEKKQLYEFYQIADVGVVPSIHEEFGYVAIEMMMHQLPVVVTDTGGLAEIIEDNISGLKIPVRTRKGNRIVDVNLLTDKICYLLEHRKESEILGINARKRFLEKYELSVFGRKILNVYNG
jgi:glycosyltransferase